MKIIYSYFLIIALTGCVSIPPIKYSFPDVPETLMTAPRPLVTVIQSKEDVTINDNTPSEFKLSQILKIITENYKASNLNNEQLRILQDWIRQQKLLNP